MHGSVFFVKGLAKAPVREREPTASTFYPYARKSVGGFRPDEGSLLRKTRAVGRQLTRARRVSFAR